VSTSFPINASSTNPFLFVFALTRRQFAHHQPSLHHPSLTSPPFCADKLSTSPRPLFSRKESRCCVRNSARARSRSPLLSGISLPHVGMQYILCSNDKHQHHWSSQSTRPTPPCFLGNCAAFAVAVLRKDSSFGHVARCTFEVGERRVDNAADITIIIININGQVTLPAVPIMTRLTAGTDRTAALVQPGAVG